MPRDNKFSDTIESREGDGVNPYASVYRNKVTDFVRLVHSSLLKRVSENKAPMPKMANTMAQAPAAHRTTFAEFVSISTLL